MFRRDAHPGENFGTTYCGTASCGTTSFGNTSLGTTNVGTTQAALLARNNGKGAARDVRRLFG